MNRRAFLAALIAGAVLDPERLLWKPGKTISIPKPRVLSPEEYALRELNQLIEQWSAKPLYLRPLESMLLYPKTMTQAEFRKLFPR